MAQASLEWQQFVNQLQDSFLPLLNSGHLKRLTRWLEASKGWMLGLIMLSLLLMWNWQLVLSAGVGLVALIAMYWVQQGQGQMPWSDWRKLWSQSNRPLTLTLTSGAIAGISTYLTLSIWLESGGSWLAKGIILQGMGTLTLLLLLIWHVFERAETSDHHPDRLFNQLLADLADADPLKRLIAIRRLMQGINDRFAPVLPMTSSHLADCFRLMLNRETEPIVCRALVDALQSLNQQQQLAEGTPPLSVPGGMKSSRVKVGRSSNASNP
ncbi:MAG: hypothetical protein HC769_23640 [Cyanobacteria bacterium CRU_2_1]|nr:hypothetical protein [Cyanobacteria bacterium CRU_2_1]